jgi:DNA-binding response OmpR family regulator
MKMTNDSNRPHTAILSGDDAPEELPEILVVEDDADSRWLVVSALKQDYRVIETDNGKDGLDRALEDIPDLVVTDLMMPVMDGIELCRRIKEHPFTSHIPVIMLTAKTSVASQIEGYETGADAYITKPFAMQLLKVQIQNLLTLRRQLRKHFSERFAEQGGPDHAEDLPAAGALGPTHLQNRMERKFWEKAYTVLKRHASEVGFSIDGLAMELGMSQRSLQRKMKALAGLTPVQWIAEYRLGQAVGRLRDKSVSVTDAAYTAGFGDLSHFYRLFKKRFGKNPSQYRDEEL